MCLIRQNVGLYTAKNKINGQNSIWDNTVKQITQVLDQTGLTVLVILVVLISAADGSTGLLSYSMLHYTCTCFMVGGCLYRFIGFILSGWMLYFMLYASVAWLLDLLSFSPSCFAVPLTIADQCCPISRFRALWIKHLQGKLIITAPF